MGKQTAQPPTPPDPAALGAAQGAANREAVEATARFNQINQVTPFGNLTFTGEPGEADRTVTQTLTPEDQARLEQQRGLSGELTEFASTLAPQVASQLGTPLSFSGLPQLPTDFNEARDAASQAAFGRLTNLLNPQIEQGRNRNLTDLANRGIPTTSQAFETSTGNFERQTNEALLNAANQAVLTGQSEQAQQFAQALSGRQQGINETLTQRSQPLNEIAALIQGAPAIGLPTFQGTNVGQVQSPDLIGANALSQSAQLAAFNANRQQNAATTGGIAGLLGAGIQTLPFFI